MKSIEQWMAVHRPSSLAWRSSIGALSVADAVGDASQGRWLAASLFLVLGLYWFAVPGVKDETSPCREWCRRLRSLKDRWEEQS